MENLPDMSIYIMQGTKYILPLLALWILLRCVRSMLRGRYEPETWAYIVDLNGTEHPVNHWECIVGRARSADIVLTDPTVSRMHASLQRDGAGDWALTDLRSKGGTFVNGEEAGSWEDVGDGDEIDFAGCATAFRGISDAERERLERCRTAPGRYVGPGVTLFILSLFQGFLALEFMVTAEAEHVYIICLSILALMAAEWFCYLFMRTLGRSGFEPETLAFFLTTLGVEVCATSTPDDMLKEVILIIAGVALYFFLGWWLRDLERVKKTRWLAAAAALGLLALNLLMGEVRGGSMNWLEIGGFTIQPSELVKVCYIYAGAATLDRLFARRNLFGYIVFSAVCVCALALMGDFGTAVIFFATFLVVSFMQREALYRPALRHLGPRLGGRVGRRFPADARHERRSLRRALRPGRRRRLAEGHRCGQYGHGVRRAQRGAGADNRGDCHVRRYRPRALCGAQRLAGAEHLLCHRRLRRGEPDDGADGAERVRLAGHTAVYRRHLPLRVQGRHLAALLLDAARLCQGHGHAQERELRRAAGEERPPARRAAGGVPRV